MTFVAAKLFNKVIPEGNLRNIVVNSGWLFADKFLRMGLNFVLNAWIARYLGAEVFGTWNYAIAFVALFSFFSTLGLYNIIIRDLVSNPGQERNILGASFILRLAGGALTLLCAYVAIGYARPSSPLIHYLVLVTGLGYLVQSMDVIDYYFQSQLKARLIVYARSLAFVPIAALKVFLVVGRYPVQYFAWVSVLELLLGAAFLVLLYGRHYTRLSIWQVEVATLRRLLNQSAPLLLSEIAIILYMRLDQIMIGNMVGDRAVGNYSAAVRLSEVWYFFPNIICSSVFSSIIKDYQRNHARYLDKLQKLYDILAWISIAGGIMVMLTSKMLVTFFFGTEFGHADAILKVHIWTGVFVFLGMASNQQLVLENKTRISFYKTLAGLFTNVILNLVLIPPYGELGAAWATLISYGMSAFVSNLFFGSTHHIFFMLANTLNIARFPKRFLNARLDKD
jgi:PST family polysaccharide transporter